MRFFHEVFHARFFRVSFFRLRLFIVGGQIVFDRGNYSAMSKNSQPRACSFSMTHGRVKVPSSSMVFRDLASPAMSPCTFSSRDSASEGLMNTMPSPSATTISPGETDLPPW